MVSIIIGIGSGGWKMCVSSWQLRMKWAFVCCACKRMRQLKFVIISKKGGGVICLQAGQL